MVFLSLRRILWLAGIIPVGMLVWIMFTAAALTMLLIIGLGWLFAADTSDIDPFLEQCVSAPFWIKDTWDSLLK